MPCFGESVLVAEGTGGVPWFISSMAVPLAPCHDPAGAVAAIDAVLGSLPALARPEPDER